MHISFTCEMRRSGDKQQNRCFQMLPEDQEQWCRLQVTSPKGHWSDIYVECNDQVNIIT